MHDTAQQKWQTPSRMSSPTVSVVLSAGRREDFQLWPRQKRGLACP